jgi:hypothetical protein
MKYETEANRRVPTSIPFRIICPLLFSLNYKYVDTKLQFFLCLGMYVCPNNLVLRGRKMNSGLRVFEK